MQCKVPTLRSLVVIATDEKLVQFVLPAESEVTITAEHFQHILDRSDVLAEEVEWRDEPL